MAERTECQPCDQQGAQRPPLGIFLFVDEDEPEDKRAQARSDCKGAELCEPERAQACAATIPALCFGRE